MPLIICPECKKNISDKAKACPHCGFPMQGQGEGKLASILRTSYLGRLLRGEYTLCLTFWLCFFAVSLAVNIFIFLFQQPLTWQLIPPTYGRTVFAIMLFAFYAAYLLICTAGVWRSAAKYEGANMFAAGAKLLTVCYTISSICLTTFGFIIPLIRITRLIN